jgi:hypothetical protein
MRFFIRTQFTDICGGGTTVRFSSGKDAASEELGIKRLLFLI